MGLGAAITGRTGGGCSLCGNGLAIRPSKKEGQRTTASCGWPWDTVAAGFVHNGPLRAYDCICASNISVAALLSVP